MIDLQAFFRISHGMYIVTSRMDGRYNGMICDALMQITDTPNRIALSVNKKELTHEFISASGVVAVGVLNTTAPLELVGLFGFKSGRDTDKLSQAEFRTGENGCPVVTQNVSAVFEAKVVDSLDAGTHTVFVCEITLAEILNDEESMTYAYYRKHLRGRTPVNAPGHRSDEASRDNDTKERGEKMKKYVCAICGYVYDPAAGDPGNGAAAGTPFEKLPEDWVCPICGAGKDQFEAE